MPLSASQIVALALQTAKTPGFTAQAGQLLNVILAELCDSYDFDVAKVTFNFNFNPGLLTPIGNLNIQAGNGPYPLPANYLRAKEGDVMWFLQGVPYPMIPVDLDEFDVMVEQAGLQSYPYLWATDTSQSPPVAYVWPPASGAFPVMVRYYAKMPDIGAGGAAVNGFNPGGDPPEISRTIPWFPNQSYLIDKLTARVMKIADDERGRAMEADADKSLALYLTLKDDSANRSKRIKLDKRRFGRDISRLPSTKIVGW